MKGEIICDGTRTENVIRLCRERGVGIEVQAFYHPDALPDEPLLHRTIERVRGIGTVAFHGPFGDLNPGSFDSLVRSITRQRIEEGFRVALRLRAAHVVFHTGRVHGAGPAEGWIQRAIVFWRSFMRDVPEDVHVYLENMLDEGPEILAGVLGGVEQPNLRANLDIGHAHCNSAIPVLDWIAALGDRIGYVHMSDNHGAEDEHLGLGKGTIPMEAVCEALEEHSPEALWAIEAEGIGIQDSLRWLDAHGFNPAPSPTGQE